MDLSSIKAENTTVEIRHPVTFEPIGLSITLRPPTHPSVKAVQRRLLTEAQKSTKGRLPAEKLEAYGLDRLIAATEAFTWGEGPDGQPCKFEGEQPEATAENARKLYAALPWVKQQIDEAMGDEAAFFRVAD